MSPPAGGALPEGNRPGQTVCVCAQISARPSHAPHTRNAGAPRPPGPRACGLLSPSHHSPTTPSPSSSITAPPLPARLAAAAAAALITLGGAGPALAAMRLPPIDNGEGEREMEERAERGGGWHTGSPPSIPRHLTPPSSLPPPSDPNRCERAFTGNTIGQANAVSDRLLDLRACKLPGAKLDGKTLSGALMADGVFDGASLVEAVLSKAYARGASFKGANMANAVLDRLDWTGADLR